MTIVDTIFKALQPAIPNRVIAGHYADLMVPLLHGLSPKDGRFFIATAGGVGGGWGAKLTEDGMCTTICLNDGDTHNGPVEQVEAKFPFIIERRALRNDSGGAGRFRGGLGGDQVVTSRAAMTLNIQADRVHCPPWGLAGGMDGLGNQVILQLDGKEISDLPNAKLLTQPLKPGDGFRLLSGGGGGYGPPTERDPELVARDVAQGYVSRPVARDIYRVGLAPDGSIDWQETGRLRNAP